jgi:hypothetical protein
MKNEIYHQHRASVGGIIPYQRSQYVGIASFLSNQSAQSQSNRSEYKISPELKKKAIIDNANLQIQSGGGTSDSSRDI